MFDLCIWIKDHLLWWRKNKNSYKWVAQTEIGIHFKKYCRLYNNVFAFSSLGGSIDGRTHKSIYVFKLHGQLYHYVPDLLPDSDAKPKFLQL